MGTRQKSKLPIKTVKQHKTGDKTVVEKALQDLEQHSRKKSAVAFKKDLGIQDSLTPLHRLRKFKIIRDRNLQKASSGRKKLSMMSVNVQKEDIEASKLTKEMKSVLEKCEITNGNEQNGTKDTNGDEVTALKPAEIETNGEVESSLKNDIIEKVEVELTKQSDISLVIDEKEEIVIEDSVNDVNNAVDDQNNIETEEKEVVKNSGNDDVDTDEECFVEGDVEQVTTVESNLEEKEKSQKEVSECLSHPSTSHQSTKYQQAQTANFKHSSGYQQSSLSLEGRYRLRSDRIEGRRSIWHSRKRKRDNIGEGEFDCEKRPAFQNDVTMDSPSVLSPGWKFISSPFTRFWTPQSMSKSHCTPYKSIIATPCSGDNEDSMAVNFDDKSLFIKLNDSDLNSDISQPSNSNNGWRCNIM